MIFYIESGQARSDNGCDHKPKIFYGCREIFFLGSMAPWISDYEVSGNSRFDQGYSRFDQSFGERKTEFGEGGRQWRGCEVAGLGRSRCGGGSEKSEGTLANKIGVGLAVD